MTSQLPIIIAGAGIVGLTLAQVLKKANIPFQIYDRDLSLNANTSGWGITVHWALAALQECLPPHLFKALDAIQVDPQQGIKDTGRFLFLDLATAQPKFVIPPSRRLRINRRKLRALLAEGVEVNWGRSIAGFENLGDGEGVEVEFQDGTKVKGRLLVGADGSSSRTRRLLLGEEEGKLYQLPVKFMGVTLRMTAAQAQPLRDIDPLLFQGSHPDTGVFMWYSLVSTPEVNESEGLPLEEQFYEGQLNISWIPKSTDDGVPDSNIERVRKMKKMAENFEARLKAAVDLIVDDTQVLELKLQDWPTKAWDNRNGTVTLAGDSAHAMTMYRGEAFNHGIVDAASLSRKIIAAVERGDESLKAAVDEYEAEMRERAHDAVLLSRQACLDAHDLNNLDETSPCVSKRARLPKYGQAA